MPNQILYEINPKPEGGWKVVRPLSVCVREFLSDRVAEIVARRTPAELEPGPVAVLHFIPNGFLNEAVTVDLKALASGCPDLRPPASHGWDHRYNADGFLTYSRTSAGRVSGYAQLFRDGVVEAATTSVFHEQADNHLIASLLFEQETIDAVRQHIALAARWGADPPHLACLSMIGVKGFLMAVDNSHFWRSQGSKIDREILQAAPVAVGDQSSAAEALRSSFDYFWQAAGWAGSHYYKEDGSRRL